MSDLTERAVQAWREQQARAEHDRFQAAAPDATLLEERLRDLGIPALSPLNVGPAGDVSCLVHEGERRVVARAYRGHVTLRATDWDAASLSLQPAGDLVTFADLGRAIDQGPACPPAPVTHTEHALDAMMGRGEASLDAMSIGHAVDALTHGVLQVADELTAIQQQLSAVLTELRTVR